MEQALRTVRPETIPDAMHPLWTAAIEHHRRGDISGAIALYQRYLKSNPQNPEAARHWCTSVREGGTGISTLSAPEKEALLAVYRSYLKSHDS